MSVYGFIYKTPNRSDRFFPAVWECEMCDAWLFFRGLCCPPTQTSVDFASFLGALRCLAPLNGVFTARDNAEITTFRFVWYGGKANRTTGLFWLPILSAVWLHRRTKYECTCPSYHVQRNHKKPHTPSKNEILKIDEIRTATPLLSTFNLLLNSKFQRKH